MEVVEKLSANNKDAVGAKLEPTIAAPLAEVFENGKANRPDRRMRNVPLWDIRGTPPSVTNLFRRSMGQRLSS